jgi:hypothetical protein
MFLLSNIPSFARTIAPRQNDLPGRARGRGGGRRGQEDGGAEGAGSEKSQSERAFDVLPGWAGSLGVGGRGEGGGEGEEGSAGDFLWSICQEVLDESDVIFWFEVAESLKVKEDEQAKEVALAQRLKTEQEERATAQAPDDNSKSKKGIGAKKSEGKSNRTQAAALSEGEGERKGREGGGEKRQNQPVLTSGRAKARGLEALQRLQKCSAKRLATVRSQLRRLAPQVARVLRHLPQEFRESQLDDDMVVYLCACEPALSDDTLRSIVAVSMHDPSSDDEDGGGDGQGDAGRHGRGFKKVSMNELGYDLLNLPRAEGSRRKTFLKLPPHIEGGQVRRL